MGISLKVRKSKGVWQRPSEAREDVHLGSLEISVSKSYVKLCTPHHSPDEMVKKHERSSSEQLFSNHNHLHRVPNCDPRATAISTPVDNE